MAYNKESKRPIFTKEMKSTHTILLPSMLPIHFKFLMAILKHRGYKIELLSDNQKNIIEEGLKYVNNDVCYPALLVIGQFISALKSGKYDLNNTALLITQTGGGCRASNYIHLLRKALNKAGFSNIPVISLNLSGLEKNPGFKITFTMIKKMIFALAYGDILIALKDALEPYEKVDGSCVKKICKWENFLYDEFVLCKNVNIERFKRLVGDIVNDFLNLEIINKNTVKVGVVGEIYIKYSKLGNDNLKNFLKNNNCEVLVPGIMNFILFKVDNRLEDIKLYGGNVFKKIAVFELIKYLEKIETIILNNLHKIKQLQHLSSYKEKKDSINGIIGYGNKMGEGWLLTAEIIDLIKSGYENIVCVQPFGCLPNHISGKGMLRKIRNIFPKVNLLTLDYDAGTSKANQENRLNLMLALANEKD